MLAINPIKTTSECNVFIDYTNNVPCSTVLHCQRHAVLIDKGLIASHSTMVVTKSPTLKIDTGF